MTSSVSWNAADIDFIRKMWEAGWSAGKIGSHLNRSRNAVIGFAHRNRDVCPERGSGKRPPDGLELPRGRRPRGVFRKPRAVAIIAAPKPPDPKPLPPPRPVSVPPPSKAALYRMLQKAVLNTGGRL